MPGTRSELYSRETVAKYEHYLRFLHSLCRASKGYRRNDDVQQGTSCARHEASVPRCLRIVQISYLSTEVACKGCFRMHQISEIQCHYNFPSEGPPSRRRTALQRPLSSGGNGPVVAVEMRTPSYTRPIKRGENPDA